MIKVRISVPTLLEITWYCASFCAAGLYEVNGAESDENFLKAKQRYKLDSDW